MSAVSVWNFLAAETLASDLSTSSEAVYAERSVGNASALVLHDYIKHLENESFKVYSNISIANLCYPL